jgi:hypothetical protein
MRKLNLEPEPAQIVIFRLPPSELKQLDDTAGSLGFTRSQWLRNWIRSSFLDQSKGENNNEKE